MSLALIIIFLGVCIVPVVTVFVGKKIRLIVNSIKMPVSIFWIIH